MPLTAVALEVNLSCAFKRKYHDMNFSESPGPPPGHGYREGYFFSWACAPASVNVV